MADLHTLLSDIQSATGPSRELDARIVVALRIGPSGDNGRIVAKFLAWRVMSGETGLVCVVDANDDRGPNWYAPRFTSSIDIIAAATRERFPNGDWLVRTDILGGFANVQPVSLPSVFARWIDGETTFPEHAATPELAFCAALIAAVIGEKK